MEEDNSNSNNNNNTTTTRKRLYKQYKVESRDSTQREVAALIEKMESNPELVARTKHLKGSVLDHKRTYKQLEICSALTLLLLSFLCSLLSHSHAPGDLTDLTVEKANYRIVRAFLYTHEATMWIALCLLAAFLSICFVLAEDVLNTIAYTDIGANRSTERRTYAQTLAKLFFTEALKVAVGWGQLALLAYMTERRVFNSLRFLLSVSPRGAFCAYFVAFLHSVADVELLVFKAFASLDKLAFQALALSSVVYSIAYAVGSPFLGSSADGSAALVMLAILTANALYPASYYYQFYVNKGFTYPDNKNDMSIIEDVDAEEEEEEQEQEQEDENDIDDDDEVNDVLASVLNE